MSWQGCKNILCIRPDNMGDLIMSAPAIRALKESFGATITVLTSSMAKGIVNHIPEIDDAIIFDLPWVKTEIEPQVSDFNEIVSLIKQRKFDAAVIFTVFSQNPLPAAMLAYLAGIPKVLAYCRENPYHLINNWVPDKEPYTEIKHQVQRDLDLVATVGAFTDNTNLYLSVDNQLWHSVSHKLINKGVELNKPWLILHAGVSEVKRKYSLKKWAEAARVLIDEQGYQILLTGSSGESKLTEELETLIGVGSFSLAGVFDLDEFICLIKHAPVLLSVNTGTAHIAAAVGTPVVVLYAQTNPQHTPWNVPNRVLPFPIPLHLRSRNDIIAFVNQTLYSKPTTVPTANDIVSAVLELLNQPNLPNQLFPGTPVESLETAAS
jgi:lipopolysaccharide heptosyltransferase II